MWTVQGLSPDTDTPGPGLHGSWWSVPPQQPWPGLRTPCCGCVMQSDSQKLTFWWPSWPGPLCLALQVGRVSFFQSHSFLWTVNASEILQGFCVVVVVQWPPPSFQFANANLQKLSTLIKQFESWRKLTWNDGWFKVNKNMLTFQTAPPKWKESEQKMTASHLAPFIWRRFLHSTTVIALQFLPRVTDWLFFLPGHSCPKTGGCLSLGLKGEGLGGWLRLMHAEQACSYRVAKGGAD